MKLSAVLYLLIACVLVCGSLPVQATKIIHMQPTELGQTATAVVLGEVVSGSSFNNVSGSKVFTETVITVSEAYKGNPGSEVRVLQLGGEVDGMRVTVHGALHWQPGEEVVVFLEPYPGGRFQVAGFSQGKFKVERDPGTGRAYVHRPPLEDVDVVNDQRGNQATANTPARIPLDRFLVQALGTDYQPSDR